MSTNRIVNGNPDVVFSQPVTIKTQSQPAFNASLIPLDTGINAAAQKVKLQVDVPGFAATKTNPLPAIPFRYYVGSSAHPIQQGTGSTDAGYNFSIPSGVLLPGNNGLQVQLTYKGETRTLSIKLPAKRGSAQLRFYPEGGNLVEGLVSTIGFEVKTAAGSPLGGSAFLMDNDRVTDTLFANSYGLGRFRLNPKPGHHYAVKLAGNSADTLYALPQSLSQGPVLSLDKAAVNDTLTVTIRDNQREQLYLTGHNYKQRFFTQPVLMSSGSKRIKLVIKDLPKGLAQLTLTDSMGRPFAERMFFAHYDKRIAVNISTDSTAYHSRKKVTVKLRLNSAIPDSGLVSVACVQANRIEIKKQNDIESYLYLKSDLGELPVRGSYLGSNDHDFVEDILLVKGWSRYSWTDMLKTTVQDTVQQASYLAFTGQVKWAEGQALNQPVMLANLDYPVSPVSTSKGGSFVLNDSTLVTEPGKRISLMVMAKKPSDYKITVADPYSSMNAMLAARLKPADYDAAGQENSHYLELPDNEQAHLLKEVKIKAVNNEEFFGRRAGQPINSNECGDYVCKFNFVPSIKIDLKIALQ